MTTTGEPSASPAAALVSADPKPLVDRLAPEGSLRQAALAVLSFVVPVVGAVALPWVALMTTYVAAGATLVKSVLKRRWAAHWTRSPQTGQVDTRVTVVMPFHNESVDTFRRSLTALTASTDVDWEAWLVDDGSASRECFEFALALADRDARVHALRLETPVGKREAQVQGFERARGEIIVTLDSDTVLEPQALSVMVTFFVPDVSAAVGDIRGRCHVDRGIRPYLAKRVLKTADLHWAGQSRWGAVGCVRGAFAAYRTEGLLDKRDAYVGERFAGRTSRSGDDRRLTFFALRRGRVVLARGAIAWTELPENSVAWVRQELRWARNRLRKAPIDALRHGPRHPAFWMLLLDDIGWLGALATISGALVAPWALALFVTGHTLVSWLQDEERSLPRALLRPVFQVGDALFVLVIRATALLTLTDRSWGSRAR